MNTPDHTPEPWRLKGKEQSGFEIVCDSGYRKAPNWPGKTVTIAQLRTAINGGGPEFGPHELRGIDEARADGARIVACVNALAGIKDVEAFVEESKEALRLMAAMTKDRDFWREAAQKELDRANGLASASRQKDAEIAELKSRVAAALRSCELYVAEIKERNDTLAATAADCAKLRAELADAKQEPAQDGRPFPNPAWVKCERCGDETTRQQAKRGWNPCRPAPREQGGSNGR